MDYMTTYRQRLEDPTFDEGTRAELLAIKDDEAEIRERFGAALAFGTAGLRGVIGAGTNRMNRYVVRKTTQGLANYILKQEAGDRGVAIAPYVAGIRGGSGADACRERDPGVPFRVAPPDAGALLCREIPSLHRRHQRYREPQPVPLQRLQGLLGGRRADHASAR